MKRNSIIFIVFFLIPLFTISQSDITYKDIDNFKSYIEEYDTFNIGKYETKRCDLYLEALYLQTNGDYRESNSLLLKEIQNYNSLICPLNVELNRCLGLNYYYIGNYDSSLIFLKDAVRIENELDTFVLTPTIFVNIAAIHRIKNDLDSSIFYNNKAQKLFEQNNDSLGLAKVENNLGNLFKSTNNEKAILHYNNALSIYKSCIDSLNIAKVNNNIALMYSDLGDKDLALSHFFTAYNIFRKNDNNYYQLKILNNIGLIYIDKAEYSNAEKYLSESLRINIDQEQSKMYTLMSMGLLNYKTKKYKDSKIYYLQALSLSKKYNNLDLQEKIYNNLLYYSIDSRDMSSFETYFELYKKTINRIREEDYNDQLAKYEQTLEVEKTKNLLALSERDAKIRSEELARQEAQLKTKNILLIFGTISIVLLISLLITLYNISRKRKALTKAIKKQKNIIANHNIELEKTVEERTKELVIAKQKAEESDLLKSSFLANLSHEIRTPLNSIMGFSDILCEEDRSASEIKDYASIVRNNGFTLLNIISDLIDVSKIEASMFEIHKSPITHSDIIRTIEEENYDKPKFFDKIDNIDFITGFCTDEFIVQADLHKLAMVFEKLINNAFQFTEKGFIEIGSNKLDDYVQFYVSDSGIGIPEERLNQIFDNFRKFRNDEQLKYSGLGVGLYIAKHIIEQMGSQLTVESKQDQGSIFSFKLKIENE